MEKKLHWKAQRRIIWWLTTDQLLTAILVENIVDIKKIILKVSVTSIYKPILNSETLNPCGLPL